MSEIVKKRKMGRPSLYSEELANEICRRLSEGEPLFRICLDDGMPSFNTVWRWEKENPDFRDSSTHARDIGTHALAGQCIQIADNPELDPQDKRVRIDTRLRLIGKWNPKRYGDKVEVEQTGESTVRVILGGNA